MKKHWYIPTVRTHHSNVISQSSLATQSFKVTSGFGDSSRAHLRPSPHESATVAMPWGVNHRWTWNPTVNSPYNFCGCNRSTLCLFVVKSATLSKQISSRIWEPRFARDDCHRRIPCCELCSVGLLPWGNMIPSPKIRFIHCRSAPWTAPDKLCFIPATDQRLELRVNNSGWSATVTMVAWSPKVPRRRLVPGAMLPRVEKLGSLRLDFSAVNTCQRCTISFS